MPPPQVVRRDGDDPYLVVAADKGTATFSDIANRIAAEYGFWLGDAFASGGSAGYDHKKMGITARGGWECVKRHFRELGIDTQSQDFTAVGIGDMAGDVFGNGMLQSPHIQLLAAFNHQHIFLDPTPDAAASFAERQRMFALPRSSWEDYDRKADLQGRRRVPAQREVDQAVAAGAGHARHRSASPLTPLELIRAILCMPVDLLWNGGIGTYVKASDESHAEVGDRANDAVRVNGARTALPRRRRRRQPRPVAARPHRVRARRRPLNTDFIDNSGGVDCSDHEVNIKILLNNLPKRAGLTLDEAQQAAGRHDRRSRARWCCATTTCRARRCRCSRRAPSSDLLEHAHSIRSLELSGPLDRALEFLPTRGRDRRAPQGRPRPDAARARDPARVLEDGAVLAAHRFRRAGGSVPRRTSWSATSRA